MNIIATVKQVADPNIPPNDNQLDPAAIRKIGNFDLILCGRQAPDTDGGPVLHWIAETHARQLWRSGRLP